MANMFTPIGPDTTPNPVGANSPGFPSVSNFGPKVTVPAGFGYNGANTIFGNWFPVFPLPGNNGGGGSPI